MPIPPEDMLEHSDGFSNDNSLKNRTIMVFPISFLSYLLMLVFLVLLFVPMFNYTFLESLPPNRGWMGNEYQLLLFGWELWGSYVNIILIFSFVLMKRFRKSEEHMSDEAISLILSILIIIVSWSSLYGVFGMLFPLSSIPAIRDDEPFFTLLIPRYGSILLTLFCIINILYRISNLSRK